MSLNEASRILKLPETTLRRMAVEGKVMAEREPRGPGDTRTVWRIRVDEPDDPPVDPPPSSTPEETQPPEDAPEPPGLTMRTLDIMDALLRANAETMERQAEQIANLRERIGRAEERATALAAERDELQRRLDDLARRPWWKWWKWWR